MQGGQQIGSAELSEAVLQVGIYGLHSPKIETRLADAKIMSGNGVRHTRRDGCTQNQAFVPVAVLKAQDKLSQKALLSPDSSACPVIRTYMNAKNKYRYDQ